MGTRGTFGLRKNKKDYLMYNHYDSYPGCLGSEVVNFVRKVNNFDDLAEKVKNLTVVKESDTPSPALRKKYKKFTQYVSTGKDWYATLRALQGLEFLYAVLHGEVEHIMLNNNFIRDSLFCEYGYIINLDTNKLEFYRGFQQKAQKGNRYKKFPNGKYYPCKLVGTAPLDNIPDDWQEKFFPE